MTESTDGVSTFLEGVRKWWVQLAALFGLIMWGVHLDHRVQRIEETMPEISKEVGELKDELKDLNKSVTRLVTLEEERNGG